MRTLHIAVVMVLGSVLVACGGSNQNVEDTTAHNQSSTADRSSMTARTSGGDTSMAGCGTEAAYFAYDSSELDSQTRDRLQRDAQCINARQGDVQITGMADARGTEEYNLALSERRARAVSGYLGNLGVDSNRVRTNAVGEEYARGSEENSWAQDRRADVTVR
ncbi:MAG: OmpA family protein [Sandaracinaceae bacterium]